MYILNTVFVVIFITQILAAFSSLKNFNFIQSVLKIKIIRMNSSSVCSGERISRFHVQKLQTSFQTLLGNNGNNTVLMHEYSLA